MQHAIDVSRGKRKAKAHSLFASCLNESKQYTKALHHLDKSLEFRPNHAGTWLKRALIQQKTQLPFSQVIKSYRQALAMDDKNHKLRLDMARFQQAHMDFSGSIATIKKKYQSLKSSLPANQILAWSYLEIGKINNARKHATIALSLQEKGGELTQAFIQFLDGNHAQALEIITPIKKKQAQTHYLLAKIYQNKKWLKHSTTQIKKARNAQKDSMYELRLSWMALNNHQKNLNEASQIKALSEFLSQDIAQGFVAYQASKHARSINKFKEAKTFIDLARAGNSNKNQSKKCEFKRLELVRS